MTGTIGSEMYDRKYCLPSKRVVVERALVELLEVVVRRLGERDQVAHDVEPHAPADLGLVAGRVPRHVAELAAGGQRQDLRDELGREARHQLQLHVDVGILGLEAVDVLLHRRLDPVRDILLLDHVCADRDTLPPPRAAPRPWAAAGCGGVVAAGGRG